MRCGLTVEEVGDLGLLAFEDISLTIHIRRFVLLEGGCARWQRLTAITVSLSFRLACLLACFAGVGSAALSFFAAWLALPLASWLAWLPVCCWSFCWRHRLRVTVPYRDQFDARSPTWRDNCPKVVDCCINWASDVLMYAWHIVMSIAAFYFRIRYIGRHTNSV